MGISIRTWVSKDGSQVDIGYSPDKQHVLYIHESTPDQMVVTLFTGSYQNRMRTTLGEIRAFVAEKTAQAEAAEVAAKQAAEPPAPPPEIPVLLPQAGDVEVIREMEPAVTSPVTPEADTTTSPGDNVEAPAALPAATEAASPGSYSNQRDLAVDANNE